MRIDTVIILALVLFSTMVLNGGFAQEQSSGYQETRYLQAKPAVGSDCGLKDIEVLGFVKERDADGRIVEYLLLYDSCAKETLKLKSTTFILKGPQDLDFMLHPKP